MIKEDKVKHIADLAKLNIRDGEISNSVNGYFK